MSTPIEWDWRGFTEPHWSEAAPEAYYLGARWKTHDRPTLLDVGCGIGRHALYFARLGFSVCAIDWSRSGIAALKQSAHSEGLAIEARAADMHDIPYPPGTFDCVLGYHSVYHTDAAGVRQVMAEVHRVLKARGEGYLTFLSTRLPKTASGPSCVVGVNTVVPLEGPEAGVPHYHLDECELRQVIAAFSLVSLEHVENIWGGRRTSHWNALVRKER